MKASVWMVVGSGASWVVASLLVDSTLTPDIGFGMLGPLVAAVGTWIVVTHAAATDRALINQRLLQGFAVKALFFAAYVAAMIRVVHVRPVPFVVSFTGYFLVLHVIEALMLQRLTQHPVSTTRA